MWKTNRFSSWINLFFVIALLLSAATFEERVAQRCKGEASFTLPECSCVVKNRLLAGWAKSNVLNAFYAPDVPVAPAEIETVAEVLDSTRPCDDRLYFMYSKQDTYYLGITVAPVLRVDHGQQSILFYERWYRNRQE